MYELLDFGECRKLERFGSWTLDRPSPAAGVRRKANPGLWRHATARYQGDRADDGKWAPGVKAWAEQEVSFRARLDAGLAFTLQLAPLPSGQVGVFPEQLGNWRWIADQVRRVQGPVRVLNLFAYTGGSTLAAAAAGAEVTHVDGAKSVVTRARANAEASQLSDRPIRWVVEDALKYCRREVKRGNQYDAVILDPPSYGHGPKGEPWSIRRDLLPLLELCGQLTCDRRQFILTTCHTPEIGLADLSAYVSEGVIGHCGQPARTGELNLAAADGRQLPSGLFARWPAA